jgi:DNA modification methylase
VDAGRGSPGGLGALGECTLKPYHRNPRQITQKRFDRLTDTLDRLGDLGGIVHNILTDEIIGGNQRTRVFGEATQVEIIEKLDAPDEQGTIAHGFIVWRGHRFAYRQVQWDENTAAEANIRANVGAGDWDWDVIANQWDAEEITDWGLDADLLQGLKGDIAALGNLLESEETEPADAEQQIDRAEELQEKWQVKTGDLWRIGEHRLLCGDSTKREDVERVMGGEKAKIVFIDPPYMTFGSSTGKLEPEDFNMLAPFWDIVVKNAQDNLDDGAPAFICCDWRSYPTLFAQTFKKMVIKNLIVWDMGGALKLGTGNFRPSYEMLVYAVNSKFGRNWKQKQSGSWKVKNRSERDLWTIPQAEAAPAKGREHPSQKPIALVERAIVNGCDEGAILFDYFCGSGTTIVACQNLSRRCRAIEIAPAYVSVCLQRMSDAFPGIAIERAA